MKKLDFNKIIGYFINRNEKFLQIKVERDWGAIVAGFFSVLILISAFVIYLYWNLNYGSYSIDDELINNDKNSLQLKKTLLRSTIDDLNAREKGFEENLKAVPDIQDPSI